jgi:hypothetical protein
MSVIVMIYQSPSREVSINVRLESHTRSMALKLEQGSRSALTLGADNSSNHQANDHLTESLNLVGSLNARQCRSIHYNKLYSRPNESETTSTLSLSLKKASSDTYTLHLTPHPSKA